MKECFKCENSVGESGFRNALVKIYSRELEGTELTIDGKLQSHRTTKERWVCIQCLLTRISNSAFEDALRYSGVDTQ